MDESSLLVRMGKEAFATCRSQRAVNLPRKVPEIEQSLFHHCVYEPRIVAEVQDALRTGAGGSGNR
jgi:hypothetical protein